MLTSQGLILATAMAVSAGTILLFDLFRDRYQDSSSPDEKQVLKSCLASGFKKEGRKQRKKKRVQFAHDVKDSRGNSEVYRKEKRKPAEIQRSSCGKENLESQKIPANWVALYSGILRDRVHRVEYSF